METQALLLHLQAEIKKTLDSTDPIDEAQMQKIEEMIDQRDVLIHELVAKKAQGFQLSAYDLDQINKDSAEIQKLFKLKLKTLTASIQGIQGEKGQLIKQKRANRTYGYVEPSTEGHFFDKKK